MKREKIKNIILIILVAFISSTITSYATSNILYNSNDVKYNNSNGVKAETVQGAIDELYACASDYSEIRNMIYPIGSIYISVTDNTVAKVQSRFGGTWEVFGEGKTLIGVDQTDVDFNTIAKTGGSKTTSYTPEGKIGDTTLTIDQIPKHNHVERINHSTSAMRNLTLTPDSDNAGLYRYFNPGSVITASRSYTPLTTDFSGGDESHTHDWTGKSSNISTIQPYITVYMYKRTK